MVVIVEETIDPCQHRLGKDSWTLMVDECTDLEELAAGSTAAASVESTAKGGAATADRIQLGSNIFQPPRLSLDARSL